MSSKSWEAGYFSYKSVVVIITVRFWFLLMLVSKFMSNSAFSSSMLEVGSSAMSILGLFANALMMAMRCFSPPDRFSGKRGAKCSRWK